MTRATPHRILLAGWLVFLLYAYPGFVTPEGADHLFDARAGAFPDWHPVMLTMLWRLLGYVVTGPAGMLLVQSGLLVIGSYLIARRVLPDRAAAIAAVCMLLVPPLLATTPVISAASMLAGLLVGAIASLAIVRPRTQITGALMLVVACGMHAAAWVAVAVVMLAMFRWNAQPIRWRRWAIALAATVATVGISRGLEALLIDHESERGPAVQLAMSDIAGTLSYANAVDARALRELAGVPPRLEEQREQVLDARRALVLAQPAAYLEHRWHVFYRVLGFSPSRRWSDVHTGLGSVDQAEVLGHAARRSWLQSTLNRPMEWLSGSFVFRPYLYLLAAIALFVLAVVRRHRLAIVLLVSGLLYELALFFVADRPEYRDSHWMIVATALAAAVLTWDSWVARRDRPRPEESPARA